MSNAPSPGGFCGPADNAAAWLAKADNDLLNIANNLRAEQVPWDTVCFHAQQAAEKALKAFLVHRGRLPARTHDLVALLEVCAELDPALRALESDCQRLNAYGVAARYPADVYEPDAEVARSLATAAAEFVRIVRTRLD